MTLPMGFLNHFHGCDRLLGRLLDRVAERGPARLVFVGDFVDRGEESAAVLVRLHRLAHADRSAVFLRGNHEEMMLRFLDDPANRAGRWLRYGGLQTLASFGIGGMSESAGEAEALRARDSLAAALGPELLGWLRALPSRFSSGNLAVVHAGADPALPIAAQDDKVLLWGHPDFARRPRRDGTWVIHGHTVTDIVEPRDGRIGVDTGAFATGRLSAALIGPGKFEVLSATNHG
jgi:serine/threonine protein phosphatase 1